MSDTPTYANLLARLFSDSSQERETVLQHLALYPGQAHAIEQDVRDRLRDEHLPNRTIAAEAMLRLYGDRLAAIQTLAGVLTQGDPAASSDTPGVLRQLGPDGVPLVVLMARHTPEVFAEISSDEFYRWVGAEAIRTGPEGLAIWRELLQVDGPPRVQVGLLMGLADAAPTVSYDLAPTEVTLRRYFNDSPCRYPAGAALWRINWRINPAWLAGIDPQDLILTEIPELRVLVLDALIEQLGRKPAVARIVRDLIAARWDDDPEEAGWWWMMERTEMIERLAGLGSRGWSVLLPMLSFNQQGVRFEATNGCRGVIYDAALARPAVLPLLLHHAHQLVADAVAEGPSGQLLAAGLVQRATLVLEQLGPAAGCAVPDLLALACKVPAMANLIEATLLAVASGYPNTAAAIVRALHRLCAVMPLGDGQMLGFQALCRVLVKLAPDTAPRLAENRAIELPVVELLIQQSGWKDAPSETRRHHATILADLLGDPRAEVRLRAVELLHHYPDQLSAVWPALVAALIGADEQLVSRLLWHFRQLDHAADTVTVELLTVFREKNPVYAARAVVAIWHMARIPLVSDELRKSVEADPESGWGWAVLRGVIDHITVVHAMPGELADFFAASPATVARHVHALINAIESPEELWLGAYIPPAGAATQIDWPDVYSAVNNDPLGMFVFLGLMLEYGSTGYANQKVWLIKNLRMATGMGLVEAKHGIEQIADRIPHPGASAADRHQAVRACFATMTDLPTEIFKLLVHPINWYRWAGLELADAWGLTPVQIKVIADELLWDSSPRVRERAMSMLRG